jgi:hypothetical protein
MGPGRLVPYRVKQTRAFQSIRATVKFGKMARKVPARWIAKPVIEREARLCLFVALARNNALMPHSIDHARAWSDAGYCVIIIVVVDNIGTSPDVSNLSFADGILLRNNIGFDFGAWAGALAMLGGVVSSLATLAIANDSVLGPSSKFVAMLDCVDRSNADVIGAAESLEIEQHFQSFLLFFKGGALRSRAFARFWSNIRSGDRDYVISRYELKVRTYFMSAGLRIEALHPANGRSTDPTLNHWRDLLGEGFPYLKVQMLRTNTFAHDLTDWASAAEKAGFDLTKLRHQIGTLQHNDWVEWAINRQACTVSSHAIRDSIPSAEAV